MLAHVQGEADPVRIESIATALRLHANTVRFHLDALQQAGLVRRSIERQGQQGRPHALFSAAPGLSFYPDLAHHGLVLALLARVQADDAPDRPIAEEIGRGWGESMLEPGQRADAEGLLAVVNELGLTSRLSQQPDGLQLHIVRCPFREFTTTGDPTVCHIHLGLIRGYLAAGGSDLTVTDLQPWVTPELCVAHLSTRSPGNVAAHPTPESVPSSATPT